MTAPTAAVPPVPYAFADDVSYAQILRAMLFARVAAGTHAHVVRRVWRCSLRALPTELRERSSATSSMGVADDVGLLVADEAVCHVHLDGETADVTVASSVSAEYALQLIADVATHLPVEDDPTDARVPVTFWALTPQGPTQRTRKLDAPEWGDIRGNYAASARGLLDRLMAPTFAPGVGGQLLLWHGPPGTGKTYGLRALAREWSPWADFHYITDPEEFFSGSAAYMLEVLLADAAEAPVALVSSDAAPGEPPPKPDPRAEGGRWRVLLLEDAGEMMSADARERAGQGLSRLLNVVDGMIGQGIRVLVVCTTNEEVRSLHPAVARPGRCAANVPVPRMSEAEAEAWRRERDVDGDSTSPSLAELYEEVADARVGGDGGRSTVGFAA